jgi:hypothetical protein
MDARAAVELSACWVAEAPETVVRPRRSNLSTVIPGLDSGIQLDEPRPRSGRLDGRVKPGQDGGEIGVPFNRAASAAGPAQGRRMPHEMT